MAKDYSVCPFRGKECVGRQCKMWVGMVGVNPSTGEPLNREDCVFTWQPVLMTENTKEVRGYAAALESFRNVVAEHPALKVLATAYSHIASIAQKGGVAILNAPISGNGKGVENEVAGEGNKSTL